MVDINDIINAKLDFDKIEKELENVSAMANNQKLKWKPTPGQTKIRLLPYIHNLKFPISVLKFHYKLGKNSWCLSNEGKTCPVCEAAKKFAIEGKEKENAAATQLAKELRAQERWFAPIIVRGKEDEGVKIWAFSKTVYEEILGLLKNTNGKILNIKEGCDIIITYTAPTKGGKQEYAKTKVDIDFQMFTNPQPAIGNMEELKAILESTPKVESTFPQSSFSDLEDAVKSFIDGQDDDESEETEDTSPQAVTEESAPAKPKPTKPKAQKPEPEPELDDSLENDLLAELDGLI